jgi:hypothetical protein
MTSPILPLAIRYGVALTLLIAVAGSLIGYLAAGIPGLISALIGAGLTAVFMGLTAFSIIVAARVAQDEASSVLFFGVVLGVWLLKFIVFITILVILRTAPFIDPIVMFVSIVAAVIGSLFVDVLAYVRARVPYVGDIPLPGDSSVPH